MVVTLQQSILKQLLFPDRRHICFSLLLLLRKVRSMLLTMRMEKELLLFVSLTKEDIEKIIDIELRELRERAEESGYKLTITPSAKKFIAEAGYDPAFGARPLKRAVMRYVEDPVSEFIISDRILQDRHKKGSSELRVLKVGLTPEKDNTLVSLKED